MSEEKEELRTNKQENQELQEKQPEQENQRQQQQIKQENQQKENQQLEKKKKRPPKRKKQQKKQVSKAGKEKNRQHEILVAGSLLVTLLISVLLYFIYFETYGKTEVLLRSENNRMQNMAQTVQKGDIVSADGVVLATTQKQEDGTEVRAYPMTNVFAHGVGYTIKGGYGIEQSQRAKLLTSHIPFWEQLRNELVGEKTIGDTLYTTYDSQLQQFCYEQLHRRAGAILAVEPKTGKILAMVSGPDYNPNTLADEWDWIVSEGNQQNANLVNRASQGKYPPGSTFKLITLLEYIRENPDTWQDFHYTCSGTYVNDGKQVNCHDGGAHGELDIYKAFALSCNGAFDTMALTLDQQKWQKLAEDFGYNQADSTLDIAYNKSSFHIDTDDSVWARMQLAIGQGTTTVTPLLNLMTYCAVANQGVMMKPYVMDHYRDANGELVEAYAPTVWKNVCSQEEAQLLNTFLVKVITEGTSYLAASGYGQVAGKTGSAQYNTAGDYHAWFCGYAPAEDPQIAVCVLIEGGGSGGAVAAPIAGEIFNYYLGRNLTAY